MDELLKLRQEIDSIDEELVKLFEKRMETVLKVADYKKQNNVNVYNKSRENEVIERGISLLNNKGYEEYLKKFFIHLMGLSKDVQNDILSKDGPKPPVNSCAPSGTGDYTIGFQGVPGSFSEQALLEFFGDGHRTLPVKTFEDVFIELENGSITYGVLPIENSSTGGISEVYDLLNKYGFYIIGEVCLKVNHCLVGIKDSAIEDISEVYSHSQAFSQCKDFLKDYPDWKLIPYHNTAKSAEYVSEQNHKAMAAISSKRASEIYGLDILKESINSSSVNTTRFVIIGRDLKYDDECDKISVVLTTAHKAGCLYSALRSFAENNINLLKVESRPIVDKPWEYFFHIDFEGNLNSEKIKHVIELAQENSHYFKLLGNYKAFSEN